MRSVVAKLLGILALAISTMAGSPVASATPGVWEPGPVAVLPFANHTDDEQALPIVMQAVYDALTLRGVSHVAADDLRPVLRRFRIRTSGQVGQDGAAVIARETGAALLLLGSVDVYASAGVPELAVSARLLQPPSPIVRRAASAAATGRDFAKPFDGGSIRSAEYVMARVLADLFAGLEAEPLLTTTGGDESRPIVVVPFDNASDYANAGDVVLGTLISELVAAGYRVVEPGASRDVAMHEAQLAAGSVDYRLLRALTAAFGPSLVVTGSVERFRAASGLVGAELPAIEISARVIDSASRRLLLGFNTSRAGDDTETLFLAGRRYSVARLAADAFDPLVRRIDEETENGHRN